MTTKPATQISKSDARFGPDLERAGFTLIELLVVIAIMRSWGHALPALSRAKAKAVSIVDKIPRKAVSS